MNDIKVMNRAADNIRILSVAMVEKAKSGHPGGAMGGADFINVLYSEFLEYDPENPTWAGRDRFYLDPGHMSPMLYAQLAMTGHYSIDDLKQFRQWGTPTPGHPERNIERGVENSSGPLGQGHVYAIGAALGAKFLAARTGNPIFEKETIYAYISDGGIQEEISQGGGRLAGHLGLDNLIMFYDANDIQLSTATDEVMTEDTAMKYRSWGWHVIEINGNDCEQIRAALKEAKAEKERPTLIIGKCIMGKGARQADNSSYECSCKTHGAPLGGDAYKNTILNLGGDLENPFVIFDEVKDLYAKRAAELKEIMAAKYAEEKAWADAHPEMAAKQKKWFAGELPEIDWASIKQKPGAASRVGSANVLSLLAETVENMMCSSADLSNSDRTDGFLNKTKPFVKGDFSGAFLQAGVAELTMACVCMGMMLHGGIIASCGTFFVFSDYMKPAIRMAALMELPIKFIWTHDAFRVGEDGPTHQPVEHLASYRAMPNINTFRPCDVVETAEAWKIALESEHTPSILALTRQGLPMLRTATTENLTAKGGYIISDVSSGKTRQATLIATGSEVSLAVEAQRKLREAGIEVAVVSMPCTELFDAQSKEYRQEVLGTAPKIAIEAASKYGWERYVGSEGKIIGLDGFGASGPAGALYQHFGITVEAIINAVNSL